MFFIPRWEAWHDEPKGPFVLNRDSPQARGLIFWMPCHPAWGKDVGNSGRLDRSLWHRKVTNVSGAPAFGRFADGTTGFDLVAANVDVFTFPTDARLNIATNAVTIMCRFLTRSTGATRTIFGVPANSNHTDPFYKYALAIRSTNAFMPMMATDTDGFTRALGGTVVADTDYHFAASWTTADDTQRNFVDGVQIATAAMAGNLISSAQDLRVGANRDNGEIWDGIIADCRIYDRALTAAEIRQAFDPRTRFDLYYELGRRLYFPVTAAGGRIMSSLAGAGGLAGQGGIAGPGGGLAG